MIRVLHGEDEYSRSEALARIRVSIGPPEVRDPNITVFEGRSIELDEVIGACQMYPFMADRRLVLVYGVLERMQSRDKSLGDEWRDLSESLSSLPATTELVFIEQITLRENAVALRSVGPSANVQRFQKKERGELEAWIRDRFAYYDSTASRESVARIGSLVGSDIRLLDQEIKKLALYAGDREITRSDIDLMVPDSRDANIFEAIDDFGNSNQQYNEWRNSIENIIRKQNQMVSKLEIAALTANLRAKQQAGAILLTEISSIAIALDQLQTLVKQGGLDAYFLGYCQLQALDNFTGATNHENLGILKFTHQFN